MEKWLKFKIQSIYTTKKEIVVTILTFFYAVDQIPTSMLIMYWTGDFINNKTPSAPMCSYSYHNNEL